MSAVSKTHIIYLEDLNYSNNLLENLRIYDWRIMSPIVSVIIVSYNTKSLLLDCIAKIPTSSLPKDQIEIIVVDNQSTDGTLPTLSSAHPTLKVIKNTVNRGVAGCGGSDGVVAGSRCGITHCWPGMIAAGRYAASP